MKLMSTIFKNVFFALPSKVEVGINFEISESNKGLTLTLTLTLLMENISCIDVCSPELIKINLSHLNLFIKLYL